MYDYEEDSTAAQSSPKIETDDACISLKRVLGTNTAILLVAGGTIGYRGVQKDCTNCSGSGVIGGCVISIRREP